MNAGLNAMTAAALAVLPWLAAPLLSAGLTRLLLGPVLDTLAAGGLLRPNYRNKKIPAGAGAAPVLAATLVLAAAVAWDERIPSEGLILTFAMLAMAWVGMWDDVLGDGRVRGLGGHLGAALRGRWTTGALKALAGILVAAAAASLAVGAVLPLLVAVPLIALAANALNLLDRRPGRAIKAFLGATGLLLLLAADRTSAALLLPAAGAAAAYAPEDLRERAMLGDVGANALGAGLGVSLVLAGSLPAQAVVLLLLVLLHLYTERASLSEAIERVPLLRCLDRLGRGGE